MTSDIVDWNLALRSLGLARKSIPAIGQVGLTAKEVLNRGLKIKVSKLSCDSNPAAGVRNETEGMVKVVYEETTDRILGVHVIGAHAETSSRSPLSPSEAD